MRALSFSCLLALACLSIAGCAVRIPDGRLSCDPTTPCPPGFSCVSGLCYAGTADTGNADTGTPLDAGDTGPQPDTGVIDTGTDSATDAGPQPDTNLPDAGCGMCTWGCDAGGTCDVPTGVFVGPANSCVTTMQGQLFCWGDNSDGQLGPSVGGTRVTHPTLIPEVASVDRVAIGQGAICARTLDGAVYCAGKNDRGQMGTGAPGSAPGTFHDRVVLGVNLADDVVGLGETFCARVHDTAYCWGANDRHQLAGTTGTTDSGSPMVAMMGDPVSSGVPVSGLVQLTAASQAFCGVFSMGIVKCWGDNTQLQASGIPSATVDRATLYTGLSNVSAVAGGAGQMVALDTTGALFGWGNGLSAMGMTPPAGPPTFHVTAVAAGRLHVCVLGNDTHVYCMGDNAFGQTTGTTGTVPAWNDVGINDVASIASGVNHTCAVGTTGDVWCWGRGDSGQIGNGTMDMVNNAAIPVP